MGGHVSSGRREAGARTLSRTAAAERGALSNGDREDERIVRVVTDVPAITRRFDYLVPPVLDSVVTVGSRIRVELHGRRVGGWVVEDDVEGTPGVMPKHLAASSGVGPPPAVVALAEWAAWRWAGPVSSFLGTASPPKVVRSLAEPGPVPAGGVVSSPGGGSVALVDEAMAASASGPEPAVVRLAPALDAVLVVLEVLHRVGPSGVLVLAPSLARAGQIAARLRLSGVPVAEMPGVWADAARGAPVVVGSRAAAWAPLDRVEAAVVLDAHDDAYREERSPTWSAVDVVIERGRRDRSPVLLVSACPTVVLGERRAVVTTSRSVERRGWAFVDVVDRTADDPRTGLYSERLARALRQVAGRAAGRSVCILNRTGRVRLLACAICGHLVDCPRCGGPMAQFDPDGGLTCRRCGACRPPVCARCDSTRLKTLRVGVTRAAEELAALTGLDAVEVTSRSDPSASREARLVVGTEAALHRMDQAELVAFLDMDHHLLAPRFGAGEEALALLARASRLVGGRDGPGRVLVQTRVPGHPAVDAAARADPALLLEPEREIRHALGLPPFGALATLAGPGAPTFADGLRTATGLSVVHGEEDRWSVRAPDHNTLCDGLAVVPRPAARLRVAVDPVDV